MNKLCPFCKSDCRPREKNALGYQVEELKTDGWEAISTGKILPTRCEAIKYKTSLPSTDLDRRIYVAFAQ